MRVVVDEVSEVVQHAVVDSLEHMRGVTGDERRSCSSRAAAAARPCAPARLTMLGPQWGVATTASALVSRTPSRSHSGVPSRRSA